MFRSIREDRNSIGKLRAWFGYWILPHVLGRSFELSRADGQASKRQFVAPLFFVLLQSPDEKIDPAMRSKRSSTQKMIMITDIGNLDVVGASSPENSGTITADDDAFYDAMMLIRKFAPKGFDDVTVRREALVEVFAVNMVHTRESEPIHRYSIPTGEMPPFPSAVLRSIDVTPSRSASLISRLLSGGDGPCRIRLERTLLSLLRAQSYKSSIKSSVQSSRLPPCFSTVWKELWNVSGATGRARLIEGVKTRRLL